MNAGIYGNKRNTLEEVLIVPTPQDTHSYRALSYKDTLEIAEHEIRNQGMDVLSWEYSLSANGNSLAAVAVLDQMLSPQENFMLALATSHNKSTAWIAGCGDFASACSNMCVWASHIRRRKHTSGMSLTGIMRRMRELFSEAVGDLQEYGDWVKALQNYEIPNTTIMQLILFDAYDKGVLNQSQVARAYDVWVKQENEEIPEVIYDPTLSGLKGVFTQMSRKNSLVQLTGRSINIETYLRGLQNNFERRNDALDYGWE